jgi:pantothenate kinase-related protein Tda10
MSGFRKAKAEQAALKIGIYGPPGSGKTFTSLLLAEGLARVSGKRIAYVDTEHGTDFYCQAVPARKLHPRVWPARQRASPSAT